MICDSFRSGFIEALFVGRDVLATDFAKPIEFSVMPTHEVPPMIFVIPKIGLLNATALLWIIMIINELIGINV